MPNSFAVACGLLLLAGPLFIVEGFSFTSKLSKIVSRTSLKQTVVEQYNENVMNTYGRYPLTISHGKGCYLYDTDGKEYLDCASGIATTCLGHSHAGLKKAISEQMERVHHCSNLYYIPQQAQLAKWLVDHSFADKVFFCNSGAEANEAAIKLTRKYAHTRLGVAEPVIITATNSFHGRTITTVTATGQAKYQKDFGPLTPGFAHVPYNDLPALAQCVAQINEEGAATGRKVAGVLLEPLQGEGGVRPGEKAYFEGVRRLCDASSALLLFDEVQTGMGRTGHLWAYEHLGVAPDILTNAKALGGGVPIGTMLATGKVAVFGPGDHASTFGGNPLACAAGLAVARAFEEEGILENVVARGEQFRAGARALQNKYPGLIVDVRGWGLMNGLELSGASPLTAADVTKELLEDGVLVVPAGPKVLRFVPPLVITMSQIQTCLDKLDQALDKLVHKL